MLETASRHRSVSKEKLHAVLDVSKLKVRLFNKGRAA